MDEPSIAGSAMDLSDEAAALEKRIAELEGRLSKDKNNRKTVMEKLEDERLAAGKS